MPGSRVGYSNFVVPESSTWAVMFGFAGLALEEKPDPGARPDPAGSSAQAGKCATLTHDYKRHGTTTLFAALSVLEGKVAWRTEVGCSSKC